MANNNVVMSVEFMNEQKMVECIEERVARYFSTPAEFRRMNYCKVYDVKGLAKKKKPVTNRNGIPYSLSGNYQVNNGLTNNNRY